MGSDKVYELGGRKLTPQELSALVLGQVKQDAEAVMGEPIAEAVVTVPAYFGDAQRQATRDAATIAGLKVERIINEPTAAALAYGLHNRSRDLRAIVLDLGGGTFDVTVLEIMEGAIEIQASSGDARLGGDDFDDALADIIAKRMLARGQELTGDPRASARLRVAAELAKQRLTTDETTRLVLPDLPLGGKRSITIDEEVSRAEAEGAWEPLLERIRGPIYQALRDASLEPNKVDEVLLVGGSTRMPCVVRLASQLFGKLPLRSLPPDEAVAMGAAVQAALKAGDVAVSDMVATDIAPFTLGIESVERGSRGQWIDGVYAPILERGTVIPASRTKNFRTVSHWQTEIKVSVYQGEHTLVKDNRRLGEFMVRGLPRAPAGAETVDVRFTYDLNGILEVEATVRATKRTTTLVIERSPGRLSKAEVEEARKRMARLKFHPRESLPNATTLARAEAAHVELLGDARELLARAIIDFQEILDTQDERIIAPTRERLAALIQDLLRSAPPSA